MRKTHAAFLFSGAVDLLLEGCGKKIPTKTEIPPDESGKCSR